MPKARATFLTVNSLAALSKVCTSSSYSSEAVKLVPLLKLFSTATEQWEPAVENCDGNYHSQNTIPNVYRNPVGYQNPVDVSGSAFGRWCSNKQDGWRSPEGIIAGNEKLSGNNSSMSKRIQNFGGGYHDSTFESNKGFDYYYNNSSSSYRENGSIQNLNSEGYWKDGKDAQNLNTADGFPSEKQEIDSCNNPMDLLDEHCENGRISEAVGILEELEKQQLLLDGLRMLKLIEACGEGKYLEEARAVYNHLHRLPYTLQIRDYNKILEMYGRCKAMTDAFSVFDSMQQRNMTSWDIMITWLAKNGHGEDAIDLFTKFKLADLKPDALMFNGVFSACGVLGDMVEGLLHFESMSKDYGITPVMQTYQSIVDMFGSAGYLEGALEFIEKMPLEPTVDIWESLMKFCRIHGNLSLGDRCAEIVNSLDPLRLDEQTKAGFLTAKALGFTEEKAQKKVVDQSLLGIRSRVHEYRAGDTSHPDSDKLYALLRCLKSQMKEAGYIPETRFVLHDIDPESKEEAIHAHSERLATANALLNSPARTPVRIMKNLRVCGDCHNALKIISKLVGRLFVMRDAKRFHHLKDGVCSCNDYW